VPVSRALVLGLVTGAAAALVFVVLPAAGVLVAGGLLVATARGPRRWALNGALLGLGGVWTILAAKGVVDCAPTGDWCGQTPLVPFVVVAVVTVIAGVALTTHSLWRHGTPDCR
jgi:hypothetical protein